MTEHDRNPGKVCLGGRGGGRTEGEDHTHKEERSGIKGCSKKGGKGTWKAAPATDGGRR